MCFPEEKKLATSHDLSVKLKPKSNYVPDFTNEALSVFERVVTHEAENLWEKFNHKGFKHNLTKTDRQAIHSLQNNRDIVIKKADKGGATVILNRDAYVSEALSQLSNLEHYKHLQTDPTWDIKTKIDLCISSAFESCIINKKTFDFLTVTHPRIPVLYLLPKIHKNLEHPPGRPIVSGVGSILQPLSQFVDVYLQEIVKGIPQCLCDTTDFLCKLQNIGQISPDWFLCSIDVQSLYTSIPHEEGMHYIEEALLNTNTPHSMAYMSNTRPGGQIRPTWLFYVALGECV
uniref:Reverse transcriptase domain-containing protein n=1 Tax=Xenopus tropicalis TaxID=8364 RepID=A0A803KAH6_XENTR